MRLWTVQPKDLYEKLLKEKVVRCRLELSEWVDDPNFRKAYDWMVLQMEQRIGKAPEGVQYPVWAWHTLAGQNKKPDLRGTEFRYYTGEQACIELEIPDHEVVLSDEGDWHIVLNDSYCVSDMENFDNEYEWFDSLSDEEKEIVKRKSWEQIFDVMHEDGTTAMYIQATFWELHLEDVKNVRFFKGRLR